MIRVIKPYVYIYMTLHVAKNDIIVFVCGRIIRNVMCQWRIEDHLNRKPPRNRFSP